MKPIVDNCFRIYYGSNPSCVIPNVMPILFFGNLDAYFKSEKRVVTVALNPSALEFLTSSGYSIAYRFHGAPSTYSFSQQDYLKYIQSVSNYFVYNPYMRWFWYNEKILRYFNASYQGRFCGYMTTEKFEKTALHIDLKAPVATDPVWGKLTARHSMQAMRVNRLYGAFFMIFYDIWILMLSLYPQMSGM